jgi:phosphoadenosine phosphosulfate reductase
MGRLLNIQQTAPLKNIYCGNIEHTGSSMTGLRLRHTEFKTEEINQDLADADAVQIVRWAVDAFGEGLAMTTSFGIHSAVMLHMVTEVVPDIPVIWIDTGYLPAKTYLFAEELTQRLNLNLKVYQSSTSPARMEALHGRLWDQNDVEALNRFKS